MNNFDSSDIPVITVEIAQVGKITWKPAERFRRILFEPATPEQLRQQGFAYEDNSEALLRLRETVEKEIQRVMLFAADFTVRATKFNWKDPNVTEKVRQYIEERQAIIDSTFERLSCLNTEFGLEFE